ncbi:MAG: DUF4286 family protein [Woeseiaceae bacterium]
MADSSGPVYEVTHTLESAIAADFDVWLSEHAQEMLSVQGILLANTFVASDAEDGSPRRVSHYHFESDEDLENYLNGAAATMRLAATKVFGERFSVSRRVLHQSGSLEDDAEPEEMCLNCGTTLAGQYCGNCGQRAQSRLISIWELVRDAFGDLLELDSRLWRTLIPLTVRPGMLTRDYLEGRRARYMPPFRTYLVLSIVFFLVAFFDPAEEFGVFLNTEETSPAAEENSQSAAQEFRDGFIDGLNAERDVESVAAESQSPERDVEGDDDSGFSIQIDDEGTSTVDDCDEIEAADLPDWMSTWMTAERLKATCERVVADDGKAFAGKLLDNVPAALIALLPLMALILKMLYPLSKRYYVEHVLFVVHFHAFVFLVLTLQILFARLTSALALTDTIATITTVAVTLYIPIYFFKAMRQVYQQNWFVTLLKFLIMSLAYMVGLLVILLITAALAAFAI